MDQNTSILQKRKRVRKVTKTKTIVTTYEMWQVKDDADTM